MPNNRMTIKEIKAKVRAQAVQEDKPERKWWGCQEGEEGVREDCCLHDLPASDEHAPGQVCCWCGDIFQPRHDKRDTHGQYLPRVFKERKRVKRSLPRRK